MFQLQVKNETYHFETEHCLDFPRNFIDRKPKKKKFQNQLEYGSSGLTLLIETSCIINDSIHILSVCEALSGFFFISSSHTSLTASQTET